MSVTLEIDNYSSVNIKDDTTLANAVDAGSNTFTLANADEFITGALMQISSPNSDASETLTVQSSTDNVVTTTTNSKLDHGSGERVIALIGDSIRIFRAANVNGLAPVDANFSILDNVAIDTDGSSTKFTDDDGSSSYWYKFIYVNTTTNEITDLANSTAVRGGNIGNYVSVDTIRRSAGFENNPYITNGYIALFRAQAQDEINSALYGQYQIPFIAPINAFIQRIALDLAAGYLLIDQYGSLNDGSSFDGGERIKRAQAYLERIQSGDLVLLDGAGNPSTPGGSGGEGGSSPNQRVTSWPNDSTATTPIDMGGGDVIFEIGKRF